MLFPWRSPLYSRTWLSPDRALLSKSAGNEAVEKLRKPLLFLIFHHSEESSHLQVTLALKEWACSFFTFQQCIQSKDVSEERSVLMKPHAIIDFSAHSVYWEMPLFYSWDCSKNHPLWNQQYNVSELSCYTGGKVALKAAWLLLQTSQISSQIQTQDVYCSVSGGGSGYMSAKNFNNAWKLVILKVTYSHCNSKPVR